MKKVSVNYKIILFFIPIAAVLACGLKGNPVMLKNVSGNEQQMVRNLKADASGDAVVLTWNVHADAWGNNYIAVERSEWGTRGNECKDCPRTYEGIGQISLNERQTAGKDPGRLVYLDKKVNRGKIYSYRLLFCNQADVCSESAVAEINFK